jgi:futalosine hydrolase
MYILIVAATSNEIYTTIEWLKTIGGEVNGHEIEVLITGVGSAQTAYALTKQLSHRTPELLIQAGIAGSFSNQIHPGDIVAVEKETMADLGAFNKGEFDDIFDLGLAAADERPFSKRELVNPDFEKWNVLNLRGATGATVNCISSEGMQLTTITTKYNAEIESMEGAAFHFVCLMEELPFIQLRSISNYAGERNKKNWKMKEAVERLNAAIKAMIFKLKV